MTVSERWAEISPSRKIVHISQIGGEEDNHRLNKLTLHTTYQTITWTMFCLWAVYTCHY